MITKLTLADLPAPPQNRSNWPWTVEPPKLPENMPDGTNWPRISIVTPSYNQAEFLEQTIRSVLLQGYPNLEYVVIDGGSQDESVEIIQRYQGLLSGWVSEKDRGQSHAINKGWSMLTGDIIAYLNSDDFYYPGVLEKIALAWQHNPEISMLTGGINFTNANGDVLFTRQPLLVKESPCDLSLIDPLGWFLPQQASFFVTSHLEAVGRFLREELHYTMDRELMYRLCRNGKVILLPDIIAGDRAHQESKRLSKTLTMYREDAYALSFCQWGTDEDARIRKRVARLRLAQGYYLVGKHKKKGLDALRNFSLAAYYNPGYLLKKGFLKSVFKVRIDDNASP